MGLSSNSGREPLGKLVVGASVSLRVMIITLHIFSHLIVMRGAAAMIVVIMVFVYLGAGVSAILGDEMGLGKTLQTIAVG